MLTMKQTFLWQAIRSWGVRTVSTLTELGGVVCVLVVVGLGMGSVPKASAQRAYADRLNEIPTAAQLAAWHEMVASKPHMAGSEGDRQVIASLRQAFENMGFDVQVHWFYPYLSYQISAEVEVLHPSIEPGEGVLALGEPPLKEDPYSADPGLPKPFNAYSASGEVIGPVVYANFGRKEDFDKLVELGIDCTGKIVIARYGGNYRGFKARFAEEAGAAGLLIYIDPTKSDLDKREVYPEGGGITDSSIQRGSILELPYPGDPLTPGIEASEHAQRLDPKDVALPKIPVQPIGWGAAQRIMALMDRTDVPEGWQGGMDMTYHLEGNDSLKVRLRVVQERKIKKTANVIATIKGDLYPDQWVIVGCHHDAWNDGAGDPTSGLISLLESARSVAQRAREGDLPARTVVFAAWGAEEFGIIGSTEWVEAHSAELGRNAVAYINLDMASMGPSFGASASPSLGRLIERAAQSVPQARDAGKTVFEDWLSRSARADEPTRPNIGSLGGGSDHVGFVCHVGVPGIELHAGGSRGSSYHTAYDDLHWYRQVVGDDYEPALMIARMTNAVVGRLASATLLPYDFGDDASVVGHELATLAGQADALGLHDELDTTREAATRLAEVAQSYATVRQAWIESTKGFSPLAALLNARQIGLERLWVGDGLAARPWYRNIEVATDPVSGYGSMILPEVRSAFLQGDAERAAHALTHLQEVLGQLAAGVKNQTQILHREMDISE